MSRSEYISRADGLRHPQTPSGHGKNWTAEEDEEELEEREGDNERKTENSSTRRETKQQKGEAEQRRVRGGIWWCSWFL